jgi:hypothetical protein
MPLIKAMRLAVAKSVSHTAEHLDYLKNRPWISGKLRCKAAQFVEFLHEISQALAAEQASEIYGHPDDDQLSIIEAAGLGGASSIMEDLCSSTTTLH